MIKEAKKLFYEKNYTDSFKIFEQEEDYYSCGLCCLLLKNEKDAKKYWEKSEKYSLASDWGLKVLEMINLKTPFLPSFFQTRAFLEVYISIFIENKLIEYAQNLINFCDFLYETNPEAYKFIARALFANSYFDLAIEFCHKTLDNFYYDPEAMLILAQSYYLIGKKEEAKNYNNQILSMVNDYYPAILFKDILEN